MSASVTLIGHTPTVTIHNRHHPPLSVSHDYCFHLIKYYNHNPFPMGPDTSLLPMILLVSDTPRHPAMMVATGQCQSSATITVDMLMGRGGGGSREWSGAREGWMLDDAPTTPTRGIIHYATLYTLTSTRVMYIYGRESFKDSFFLCFSLTLWVAVLKRKPPKFSLRAHELLTMPQTFLIRLKIGRSYCQSVLKNVSIKKQWPLNNFLRIKQPLMRIR